MFWRFGGYANISTIDTLLDKLDVTLEELLDESDLIQELKNHNAKLIEFLRGDDALEKLLEYVIAPKLEPVVSEDDEDERDEGDESKDKEKEKEGSVAGSQTSTADDTDEKEKKRNRYAYVAAEILSSDSWSLSAAVLEQKALLRKFWDFLKLPVPLDPLQASYFTKVNEALLDKKTEEMLDLFKSLDNVVANMLQHVDSPMVMDLLLKIISLEKAEGGQGIVDVRYHLILDFSSKLTWIVASLAKSYAYSFILPFLRAFVGHSDFSRRLLKGHHYYFCKCLSERAIVYRAE
jgi:SIT4-associating protein SAP185/190